MKRKNLKQLKRPSTSRQNLKWVIVPAAIGECLRWLAQPPCNLWPLVFLAVLPALWLVTDPRPITKRGYLGLWFCGFLFWLISIQGIRLAHPVLYPGYLLLVSYFGVYSPAFVGLTRLARMRSVPLWIAGPTVWVGLEVIRGYAFTGYSACLLGHSLLPYPRLFQVADLFGTYTVSAVIVSTSVALVPILSLSIQRIINHRDRSSNSLGWRLTKNESTIGFLVGCGLLLATGAYGQMRLQSDPHELAAGDPPLIRVALLQADIEAIFEANEERDRRTFKKYTELSRQAARQAKDQGIGLLVWPESMFIPPQTGSRMLVSRGGFEVPAEFQGSRADFVRFVEDKTQEYDGHARSIQRQVVEQGGFKVPPALMVGASQFEFARQGRRIYSAALCYNSRGTLEQWYGKRHLVMFGEYIPFANWLPWLYQIGPLSFGVTPGPAPMDIILGDARISPSICFETMVERVTNADLRVLLDSQRMPNLLVNITNDGWFHGSSILDQHLRGTQAAAASHHLPILVAANSGLTAWIDGSGRIRQILPRQTEGILLAAPLKDERSSLYLRVGDWPARIPALVCIFLAITGFRDIRRRRGQASLS